MSNANQKLSTFHLSDTPPQINSNCVDVFSNCKSKCLIPWWMGRHRLELFSNGSIHHIRTILLPVNYTTQNNQSERGIILSKKRRYTLHEFSTAHAIRVSCMILWWKYYFMEGQSNDSVMWILLARLKIQKWYTDSMVPTRPLFSNHNLWHNTMQVRCQAEKKLPFSQFLHPNVRWYKIVDHYYILNFD